MVPDKATLQTVTHARRVPQGKKIPRLKQVPVAISHSETQKAFTLILARRRIVIAS